MRLEEITKIVEKKATRGDNIKTHLKAAGSRFLNKHGMAIGSLFGGGSKSRSNYALRVAADRMQKAWAMFKYTTDTPQTRQDIYEFLGKYYRKIIGDAKLRAIVGLQPVDDSDSHGEQEPSENPQGEPQQQNRSPGQARQQAGQAGQDQGQTGQPNQQEPSAPEANQAAPLPFTPAIKAHLMSLYSYILNMHHPRMNERHIVRPNIARESWQPRLRLWEARQTVAGLLRQMLDIGRKGDEETKGEVISLIGKLKINRFTAKVPQIEELPLGPEMFDPGVTIADDATPAAAAPTQQQTPAASQQQSPLPKQAATPSQPQQTPASGSASPVPPTGNQQPQTNAKPAAPVAQATTPAPAPATTSPTPQPQATTQTAQPQANTAPQADPVAAVNQQITSLLAQSQINSAQIMQVIARALHATQAGSPQRKSMQDFINSMRTNKAMLAKVPQLATMESRRVTTGKPLLEEPEPQTATEPQDQSEQDQPEELSKSEIDQIFINIAKELAKHADPDNVGGSQTKQNSQQASSPTNPYAKVNWKKLDDLNRGFTDFRPLPEDLKKLQELRKLFPEEKTTNLLKVKAVASKKNIRLSTDLQNILQWMAG